VFKAVEEYLPNTPKRRILPVLMKCKVFFKFPKIGSIAVCLRAKFDAPNCLLTNP